MQLLSWGANSFLCIKKILGMFSLSPLRRGQGSRGPAGDLVGEGSSECPKGLLREEP